MKTTYKLCTILFFSLTIIVNAQAQQVSAALSNKSNQDSAHVFLAGLVGTDALNLSSVTASGGLQIGAIVGKFSGFISYNFSSAVSKPQQADSVPLSSVFFTDEGSSAFSERLDYTMEKRYGDKRFCSSPDWRRCFTPEEKYNKGFYKLPHKYYKSDLWNTISLGL